MHLCKDKWKLAMVFCRKNYLLLIMVSDILNSCNGRRKRKSDFSLPEEEISHNVFKFFWTDQDDLFISCSGTWFPFVNDGQTDCCEEIKTSIDRSKIKIKFWSSCHSPCARNTLYTLNFDLATLKKMIFISKADFEVDYFWKKNRSISL